MERRESVFAAKRLYRTAQGFSPALALGQLVSKRCPESGNRCWACWWNNTRRAWRRASVATFRANFSRRNPGLKPWAILYSRFAAEGLQALIRQDFRELSRVATFISVPTGPRRPRFDGLPHSR